MRDLAPVQLAFPLMGIFETSLLRLMSALRQKRSVANSVWEEADCSVVINSGLAMERRGGRGGGGAIMLVRRVDRDQRPWNKGLLIGHKKPLEPKHVWSIRVRLEIGRSWRDLVIFNLAIDSKLRASDLVKLRLDDICSGAKVRHRATVVQRKTGRPVQFEITEQCAKTIEKKEVGALPDDVTQRVFRQIGHNGRSITSRHVHSADAVLLAAADAVANRTLERMGMTPMAQVIEFRQVSSI
jgi:hypothetical protein